MTVFARLALAIAAFTTAASAVSGQSVWNGSVDANWSTAANWNTPPATGSTVAYDSTSTGNLATGNNDLTGLSLAGITVTTVPSAVTFGGNAITLTGATAINMTSASANLTINTPLVLGGATTFLNDSAAIRTLTIGGPISGPATSTLALTGNPANNNSAFILSGANTYSGPTTITRAVLSPGAGLNNVFSPNSILILAGNTGGNTLVNLNGTNQTVAGLSQAGSNTRRVQGGSATLSTLTINVPDGVINTYTSTVGQSGNANNNNLAIIKTGLGLQEFANTSGNYFITAPTTIQAGALGFLAANGGSTSDLVLDGGVFQNQGATGVTFNRVLSAVPGNNNFRWTANGGGFSARAAVHTINIGGASAPLTWGTNVGAEIVGPLKFGHQSATSQVIFQNPIFLNGAIRTIDVQDNPGSVLDKATLSGTISDSSTAAGINKTGTGVLELAATNTYGGTTTISGGVLSVVSPSALPGYDLPNKITVQPTATLQVRVGTGAFSPTDFNTLLGNTAFNGNSFLGLENIAPDSYTFAMPLPGPAMGLRKDGTGELIIPGANTFTGGVVIAGGVVQVGHDASFGTGGLTTGGATLNSPSNRVINNTPLAINGATTFGTATNTGTFTFAAKFDFSGALRNITFDTDVIFSDGFINGTITKIGLGTLTLRGGSDSGARNNNFTRGTTVLDSGATYATNNGFRVYSITDDETTTVNLAPGSSLNITTTLTSSVRVGFDGNGGVNRSVVVNFAGSVSLPVGGTGGAVLLDNEGASNTANLLTGGLISLTRVGKDTGGTATIPNVTTFNFNGGTLRALQNETAFIGGVDFANVQAGGGTIDSNTFNVALTVPLLAGSPSGGITKIGMGTLTYSTTPSTYTGTTTISLGTLVLPTANNLPAGNPITLSGGTLRSQDSGNTGQNQSFGPLALTTATSSGIALGVSDHTLAFTTLTAPPTASLAITGWLGTPGASGTDGKIQFSGLTDAATANATYSGFLANVSYPDLSINGGMFIDINTGVVELVPFSAVPEPALLLGLASGLVWFRRRRA